MNKKDDTFEELLMSLEQSGDLTDRIEDVPEDFSAELNLIHQLRSLVWPVRDPEVVSSQRKKLLAKTLETPIVNEKMNTAQNKSQDQVPFWKKFIIPSFLFSGALLLLVCAVITISAGVFWLAQKGSVGNVSRAPLTVEAQEEMTLRDMKGFIEIYTNNRWHVANSNTQYIENGNHIKTGPLSSVIVAFRDGSLLHLGPESEIIVENFDFQTDNNRQEVVLTLVRGTSFHEVNPKKNESSRYEVRATSGVGIAMGTAFTVKIIDEQTATFSVQEGKVSVTSSDETVIVESGEITTTSQDEIPEEPTFFITGSGRVSYIGSTWVIGEQVFSLHENTVVIGNPQVGDMVLFEGRLLPDDTRLADLIVLIQRSQINKFSLTGIVNNIGDQFWVVNDQEVAVTDITKIEDSIKVGDLVFVKGLILPDSTLQAEEIHLLENQPGLPFEFSGVIEMISEELWEISGIMVDVDESTQIDEGLIPGELVHVAGWILEDGTWLARTIDRMIDEERAFEFNGKIDTIAPWQVAGIPFEIRDWTFIDDDLEIGDLVTVKGQVMEDGTWVAYEIRKLDEFGTIKIILIGIVSDMNPWVVNGITLNVDEETIISGEITLGMLVRVEIQPLPDGSWKVLKIEPVSGFAWGFGCQEITARIVTITKDKIQLLGWPALPVDAEVGDIEGLSPNSIVLIQVCFGEDGSAKVVLIILLYQIEEEEVEIEELPEGLKDKVMVCHKPNSKNPHNIVISKSAVPAHLGHGDVLGPCP